RPRRTILVRPGLFLSLRALTHSFAPDLRTPPGLRWLGRGLRSVDTREHDHGSPSMRVTDVLRSEHEVIQQVLDCLERLAERASANARLDVQLVERALEFLVTFADRCHHGKEEGILFPALIERGLPSRAGPIAVMLQEHDVGRAATAKMRAALDEEKRSLAGAPQRFAA